MQDIVPAIEIGWSTQHDILAFFKLCGLGGKNVDVITT